MEQVAKGGNVAMADHEIQPINNELQNSDVFLTIQVPSAKLEVSPAFKRVLKKIPELNEQSAKIQAVDLNEIDEDQITELNKQMRDVSKYDKKFKDVQKAIRDSYNKPRNQVLNWFNTQLESAGYDDFEKNIAKNKQLRRDVIANRANKRWQELETTFKATLQAYPIVAQMAPKLADFTTFRVRNPKLVSGAKTRKINDKARATVTNTIAEYSNALKDIQDNASNLKPPYQRRLLEAYVNDPTPTTLMNQTRIIRKQQAADEAMQKQLDAQKAAQAKQALQHPTPTQPTLRSQQRPASQDYSWLLNYIATFPNGRNVHDSDAVKANVIYDLYHKFTVKNSVWYPHVKGDPSKLVALTKIIVNL